MQYNASRHDEGAPSKRAPGVDRTAYEHQNTGALAAWLVEKYDRATVGHSLCKGRSLLSRRTRIDRLARTQNPDMDRWTLLYHPHTILSWTPPHIITPFAS